MDIQLLPPFNSRWSKGYKVFDSSTGRFRVVFYNSPEDISGMSYARYLMSVHLGYVVPDDLVVDHINDIKTDDRIENLQLLTPEQNRLKQEYNYYMYEQPFYLVQCEWCDFHWFITERDLKAKIAKGLEHMFCSRRCAAKFHHHGKQPIQLLASY